jgi:hypothetical protein
MPELARDMRQKRTFTSSGMYNMLIARSRIAP